MVENRKEEGCFDGWNIALAVGDILGNGGVCAKYGIDEYAREDLEKVFPEGRRADPDEVIPDSILPWLKNKESYD